MKKEITLIQYNNIHQFIDLTQDKWDINSLEYWLEISESENIHIDDSIDADFTNENVKTKVLYSFFDNYVSLDVFNKNNSFYFISFGFYISNDLKKALDIIGKYEKILSVDNYQSIIKECHSNFGDIYWESHGEKLEKVDMNNIKYPSMYD